MPQTSMIISSLSSSRDYLLRLVDCTRIFSRILCVRNNQEAVKLLQTEEIDTIFLDWQPPEVEQLNSLAEVLGDREEWCDIPLLLFTPDPQRDAEILALQKGAGDCFDYGITARELGARLHHHLAHKQRTDELRAENSQLAKLAISDRLTGLYNRSYFDVVLEFEAARCQRHGSVLSLLIITIDSFNWLENNFGHRVGDSLLRLAGDVIQVTARKSDIPCRFNHQDFAIILPDTPTPDAFLLAERIRREIMINGPKKPLSHFTLSLSMGISGHAGNGIIDPRNLVDEAYCAVETGRRHGAGRTEIFHHDPQILTRNGHRLDIEHPQGHA